MPKAIQGPTVKIDSSLPCGCCVSRQSGTTELRMWFCCTHEAAFDIRDALESNRAALRNVIEHVSSGRYDLAQAMEAGMKARAAIRKASRTFWSEARSDG